MLAINKSTIGIAAGVAGTLFLGYCIYFDKQRRSDPEYKKKVRERRRRTPKKDAGQADKPNLNDHESMERYFLQEIQMGETLIAGGDFDNGVSHLANAIMVCGQPTRLLQVLQSSLPAQVFAMLIAKMQEFANRANANEGHFGLVVPDNATILNTSSESATVDDLE